MKKVSNVRPDPKSRDPKSREADPDHDPDDSQAENDIELVDSMSKNILCLKIPAVMLFVLSVAIVFFLLRDIGEMKSGGAKNMYVFNMWFTAVVCFVKALCFMFYARWKRRLSFIPLRMWGWRILGISYLYFIFYFLVTSDEDPWESFRVFMAVAVAI